MKSHSRRSPGFRAVGHGDFTSERIAVESRTGSCGRFHPRTHSLLGGYPRLVALGGSRSCATADGTPVDTDAKNCVPPASAIDSARRGGIVVEAWGRRLSQPPFVSDETGFCVFRGKKHTTT